jgi:hypothetical protein
MGMILRMFAYSEQGTALGACVAMLLSRLAVTMTTLDSSCEF